MKALLASKNPSKLNIYGNKLKEKKIEIYTLKDLDIHCDVDETGKDPIENAIIKATSYAKLSNIPTIAIDDGLYLEGVPPEIQPGTHVRRVNGITLTDEEMIEYYQELIRKYGQKEKLKGYYLKGVAVVYQNQVYQTSSKHAITLGLKKNGTIHPGYPLDSLLMEEKNEDVIQDSSEVIGDFLVKTLMKLENK